MRYDDTIRDVVEQTIDNGDPLFRAAVGSLGAIGIITKVRFRTVEERYFETLQRIVPLDTVLTDVEKTSVAYDFWRIDWIPDSDQGLLWCAKRIPADEADPNGDYPVDRAVGVLKWLFENLSKLEKDKGGPLLSRKLKAIYKVLAGTYGETKARGPLRNMLPVDRTVPLRVAMSEWAFAPDDLARVLRHCRSYFKKAGWPNLPIEIELAKTDGYLMSPWNWSGLPYVVKFNFMYLMDICRTPASRVELVGHLEGLWKSVRQAGIPFKAHWGKLNFIDPAFTRSAYRFDDFEPLVQQVFVNEYLRKRFWSY